MSDRKERAVRLFDHALRLLPKCTTGRSGKTGGKLEQSLQNYGHRLRELAREDPDSVFWSTLQKANLKMIKYLLDNLR
jgi:hypothetical protein